MCDGNLEFCSYSILKNILNPQFLLNKINLLSVTHIFVDNDKNLSKSVLNSHPL